MLESAGMEVIREAIEWLGNEAGAFIFTMGPYVLVALVAVYVLWLLVGYLRVSQVGLGEGRGTQAVVSLHLGELRTKQPAPGAPYCAADELQYPVGATYCTACERDLQIRCAGCGATVNASEASCYRCGTPTGAPGGLLPG